jgi:hypothetical protein
MTLTPTDLRARLYAVLDQVLSTGEPVFVARGGRLIRIALEVEPPPKVFRWDQLVQRPDVMLGEDDISDIDWTAEWSPPGAERDGT